MKRKAEYIEGPGARENFEQTLTKIFQAPKKKAGKKRETATARKTSGKSKG